MKTTLQKHESLRSYPEAIANHSINSGDYPTVQGACKATLKAQFALAGYVVHDGCDGDFFVVRADWGMSGHCEGNSALIAFGRKVGVCHE